MALKNVAVFLPVYACMTVTPHSCASQTEREHNFKHKHIKVEESHCEWSRVLRLHLQWEERLTRKEMEQIKHASHQYEKKRYTVNGNLIYTQTIFFYNIHNLLIDSTASFMGVFIKFQ